MVKVKLQPAISTIPTSLVSGWQGPKELDLLIPDVNEQEAGTKSRLQNQRHSDVEYKHPSQHLNHLTKCHPLKILSGTNRQTMELEKIHLKRQTSRIYIKFLEYKVQCL